MPSLIITNGDSAADLLKLAGKDGTILPWRDVLHEGPIVETALEACSRVRADYFARRFRIDTAAIAAEFAARDAIMRRHNDYEAVELWFEHDLYDQLQLVQILGFFAGEARTDGVAIVQADAFLGHQTADTILAFAEGARPAARADLDLAAAVWADLLAPTPEPIAARRAGPPGTLPYLKPALERFLEELPAPGNGLGRTEQTILEEIAAGTTAPATLFPAVIGREEAAFMGDWSFFRLLDDLASCDLPLIAGLAPAAAAGDAERLADAELMLTMAGEAVLAGEDDHVAMNGLDRWWAGTRLSGRSVWRYDREAASLVPPGAAGA